jgi:carboxymethylenebutenolidase
MEERRRLTRGPIADVSARVEQMHWIGYMREELRLERVGGIGYCMGGRMGLCLGVSDSRLECFAAFYPTVRMPAPDYALPVVSLAAEIRCHVHIHYPGLDQATSYETFSALRAELESRPSNMETVTHYYPEAEHGFMSDELQHKRGNAQARTLAEPQTIAFFRSCLS